jgi:hypothetical protein
MKSISGNLVAIRWARDELAFGLRVVDRDRDTGVPDARPGARFISERRHARAESTTRAGLFVLRRLGGMSVADPIET